MAYYAEIDGSNQVLRVIVADDPQWISERLGGTWIETQIEDATEQYAGIGMYAEADHPKKFAPQWSQPVPGISDGFPVDSYTWHNDRIWQSTVPNNVWEPGVFGWRDKTDLIPAWRQPLGAGDAWGLNDEVLHNNKHWKSLIANNVWEPGAVGSELLWQDITETPPSDTEEWAIGVAYSVDDEVKYQGTTYRCRQAHTSQAGWTPPVVPALWLAI